MCTFLLLPKMVHYILYKISIFFYRVAIAMDFSLKEIIKKFTVCELLSYLRYLNLQLESEDFEILRNERISGYSFFYLTKKDLLAKLHLGPAVTLSTFISQINSGNLPQEDFIPSIIKLDFPYRIYFNKHPFKDWSFESFKRHYSNGSLVFEIDNAEFIDNICKIKDDPGTLKEIRDKLDKIIDNDLDLNDSILSENNINLLIKKISKHYKSKAFREFYEFNESSFQTLVETLFRPENWISEMRIIKNNNNASDRYGFPDILLVGVNKRGFNSNIVIELKYLTLKGLLSGERNKLIEDFNYSELKKLDDELSEESDEKILSRKYYCYFKDKKKFKLITVRSILDSGLNQTKHYINVIKKGQFNKVNNMGILDDRVNIDIGDSIIGGWLIISLGSKRFISIKVENTKMNYNININKR